MGYEKILTETTSQEKLKMRHWVNSKSLQMREWKVYKYRFTLHWCRICNIKIFSRSQVNKSKGNIITPDDDPEIVAGDRLTPAQEKLAYCVGVMVWWMALDSNLQKRKRLYSTNKKLYHASTGQSHDKC
jgi:hypothetical protein